MNERNRDQLLRTETIKAEVGLSLEAKAEAGDIAAVLDKEIEELEAAKKSYNEPIKTKKGARREALTKFRTGKETRDVDCEVFADYETNKLEYVSLEDGKVVKVEDITTTDDKRQELVPLKNADDTSRDATDGDSVDGEQPDNVVSIDRASNDTPAEDLPELAQLVIAAKFHEARTAVLACGDPALLGEVLAAEEGMRKNGPRKSLTKIIKIRIGELERNAPVEVSEEPDPFVPDPKDVDAAHDPADTTRDGGLFSG